MNKAQKTEEVEALTATRERFMTNQKLGKRIRILREQAKLTQGDVANVMECHWTTVQVWENSNPLGMSVSSIIKLAKVLGANPQDLLRGIHL